jgi:hypothetical protein
MVQYYSIKMFVRRCYLPDFFAHFLEFLVYWCDSSQKVIFTFLDITYFIEFILYLQY